MNETELQAIPWDLAYEEDQDVILIDSGDSTVFLTRNDLYNMLEEMENV